MQLLKYKDLEEWQKDNHLIETGYRKLQGSYLRCLKTIPRLHNETVNIWTHLIGSCVAIFTLAFFLLDLPPTTSYSAARKGWTAPFSSIPYLLPHSQQPSVDWFDTFGICIFLVSAATCLGLSSLFHTFLCHSMEVAHSWNRMDYIGIVVLISGTFVSYTHYGFFCDPHLRNLYIAVIYTASAATIWVVISPKARTPSFRRLRTWLFISLGLSAVGPVGHAIYQYGLEEASDNISLFWLASGGALYIVGALLYAERTPERFAPGRFDFFGSSHQIFHVLILLAAWSHWTGILEGFRYHHGERGGVCL
ncbi:hemolysin III family protein [Sporobolomyces salmoneus]|uniref:hemolysin III family protein n=1 Tax=Sporobolomyces salmoneus TaxID=183962 RepID=UPI003171C99C